MSVLCGKMSLFAALLVCALVLPTWSATHDEIPQCSLTGVYKTRQSILESPNYPNNYPTNTCWDYVVRSPYHCPTKFHIQFLDFYLESSPNCVNDYLAVGLENVEDDMDLLCGQVIGIKKYHTPDGILRLRFFSDPSPWTTGKGFKLLVTRLACERDDFQRAVGEAVVTDDDTEVVNAPPSEQQLPHDNAPPVFRNLTQQDHHRVYPVPPVFGWNLPNQFPFLRPGSAPVPAPPPPTGFGGLYSPIPQRAPTQYPPATTTERPCTSANTEPTKPPQSYAPYWGNLQRPLIPDQYAGLTSLPTPGQFGVRTSNADSEIPKQVDSQLTPPVADSCCISSFRQRHFYLSSPGFPRTVFSSLLPTQHRDCEFAVEKAESSICRLRLVFKFFDFGQPYRSTGLQPNNIEVAIGTSKDVCSEDFIEIDCERFCGCRSGYVYTSNWPAGKKKLRLRMGYSGIPSNGFLLELNQEECTADDIQSSQQLGSAFNKYGGTQQIIGQVPNNFNAPQNGYPLQQYPQFPQQQLLPQIQPQYPQLFAQPGQLSPQQPYQPYPLTQPFWAPQSLGHQQFGAQTIPQYRNDRSLDYARAASVQQPVSVVETNSTRKEYYYFDGDEAFQERALHHVDDEPEDTDRYNLKYINPQLRNRCSFDTSDVLKLTVDPLWITKPTCYAPLRSWFSNIFG